MQPINEEEKLKRFLILTQSHIFSFESAYSFLLSRKFVPFAGEITVQKVTSEATAGEDCNNFDSMLRKADEGREKNWWKFLTGGAVINVSNAKGERS